MSSASYFRFIVFGFLFLLASVIMFILAQGAIFPATSQRYLMFGIGAAVFAVLMFGVGIWLKKGENKAPKHEIAKDDEGWSTSSS